MKRHFALLRLLVAVVLLAPVWAKPKLMTQPLGFERNEGQTASQVKYFSRGPSCKLFLTQHKAVLSLPGAALEMTLQGANRESPLQPEEQLPGAVNYLIGDPSQWHRAISLYARVRYRNVYPGIDLVYYARDRKFEYDFVVAPGADPRAIRVAFKGNQTARIDSQGDLVLSVAGKEVVQHRPVVYQERDGRRQLLGGHYLLHSGVVTFKVSKYDPARPLVIDPTLTYSTYLGATHDDEVTGMALDPSGNIYISGSTEFSDFPTTSGAFMPSTTTLVTPFVSKISPDQGKLIYSTFVNGTSKGMGEGIAVNSAGQAFLIGMSWSEDFPTTPGAYGTADQGSAFISKLSADGSSLLLSTLLHGDGVWPYAIATDSAGAVYLAGSGGDNLGTTPGAYQTTASNKSKTAGFFAKLNADFRSVAYVSYFSGDDYGVDVTGLAVDSAGNLAIAGFTSGTDLHTTQGAPQTTPPGVGNGFVFKFNATGTQALWGTYLGGDGYNYPSGITVDGAGNYYVVGDSNLEDAPFPTTAGAYRTECSLWPAAWLVKYNPQGQRAFSTCLGRFDMNTGYGSDQYWASASPAIDAAGNIYVMGTADSTTDFKGTADAYQRQIVDGDGLQIVLAELDPSGSNLLYGTFYGGTGDETGRAMAMDPAGSIYISGITDSKDLPVTPGAVQPTQPTGSTGGGYDIFVAKFLQAPGPKFTAQGIVNAASFQGGPIAPGEMITIFGSGIGPSTLAGYHLTGNRFDSMVAQTRVLFDGVAAPIIYASSGQTAVVVPYEIAGQAATQVVVEYQGVQSSQVSVQVAAVAPGIFTVLFNGTGQGAVLNTDYRANAAGNPAARGSVVMVYMTVGGEHGQDGMIATGAVQHPLLVTATIGGQSAQVQYAGPSPGSIWGLTQVNLMVPASVTPGNAVPLAITVGGVQSQPNVTLAVN